MLMTISREVALLLWVEQKIMAHANH
jgi:hypothetical protein